MKSDDLISSIALIKVEKLFNALKKDSVLKVKKKLILLNILNLEENTSVECNPQLDVSQHAFHSKMEVISETPMNVFETPIKNDRLYQPTSSYRYVS